jgi:hypothetical protein
MVVLPLQETTMASTVLKGLIRGAVPLARRIFNDPTKRRLIPELRREGWPIFDVAGKPSGIDTQLDAHARKIAQRRARRQRRSKTTDTAVPSA